MRCSPQNKLFYQETYTLSDIMLTIPTHDRLPHLLLIPSEFIVPIPPLGRPRAGSQANSSTTSITILPYNSVTDRAIGLPSYALVSTSISLLNAFLQPQNSFYEAPQIPFTIQHSYQ